MSHEINLAYVMYFILDYHTTVQLFSMKYIRQFFAGRQAGREHMTLAHTVNVLENCINSQVNKSQFQQSINWKLSSPVNQHR